MGKFVTLKTELNELRQIDKRLLSYNVEMTEVTGGTFWKAYTEAQVDGTEEFPPIKDWKDMGNLQQWYDPIDTTNPRLIKLAKELGSEYPAHGQTRHTMILMDTQMERFQKAIRIF